MTYKTLLATLLTVLPVSAFAANTVAFEGTIDDTTCQVLVDGQRDATVTLPPIQVADLNATGSSDRKKFVFEIKDCPVSSTVRNYGISMGLIGPSHMVGRITVSGTATGVDLALYPAETGWEELFMPTIETSLQIPAGATTGLRNYYVAYASGARNATPGTVRGAISYTVTYP